MRASSSTFFSSLRGMLAAIVSTRASGAGRLVHAGAHVGRHLLVDGHVADELTLHRADERLDLGDLLGALLDRPDVGRDVLPRLVGAHQQGALDALDQHADRTVGELEHLQDPRHRSCRIQVVDGGVLDLCVFLGREKEGSAPRVGRFDRLHRALAAHEKGHYHARKHHDVPQRDQGELVLLEQDSHGLRT